MHFVRVLPAQFQTKNFWECYIVSSWSLVGWSLYQQIVLLHVQNFQSQMMLRIDIALPSGKRKRLEVPSSTGDFKILVQKSFRQGWKPCPHWSGKIFACGLREWRPAHCRCASSQFSGIKRSLCSVVLWRWQYRHLGEGRSWWWQLCCPVSAQYNVQQVRPQALLLLRSWTVEQLLHGVLQSAVVTALLSKIGSRMCSRFRPQHVHLLPCLQMDLLLHGVIRRLVGTALTSKIFGMCSRSGVQRVVRLLPSWKMDPWWHGALSFVVVTALQSKISSGVCSRFRPHISAILEDGSVVTWGNPDGGDSSAVQDQLKSVRQLAGAQFAFAAVQLHSRLKQLSRIIAVIATRCYKGYIICWKLIYGQKGSVKS